MRGYPFLPWLVLASSGAIVFGQTVGSQVPSASKPATGSTAARKATPPKTAHPAGSTASKDTTTAAKAIQEAPLVTNDEKTIYALGLSISKSIGQFDLSPAELDVLKRALTDSAAGKPAENLAEWGPHIPELARERGARVAEKQRTVAQAYLDKAAAEPGANKTSSGLVYRELRAGTGPAPKPSDTVKVNYRGTLVDGTEFDNSYARNEPASFELNRVVSCWTEGLQLMKVGGKAMLSCPASLAYGDQGRPGIPPGAALIFEVELLEVHPSPAGPPEQPGTPQQPAAPQQPGAPQ